MITKSELATQCNEDGDYCTIESRLVSNLESLQANFDEFGVTDSVKALLMTDPLMAERIQGKPDEEIITIINELHSLAVATEELKPGDKMDDKVLGKLTKREVAGWERWGTFDIMGKKGPIKIIIPKDKVTKADRDCYALFKEQLRTLNRDLRKAVVANAKDAERQDSSAYQYDPQDISEIEYMGLIINGRGIHWKPEIKKKTKLNFAIIGECAWDPEHGVGVCIAFDSNQKVIGIETGGMSDFR